MTGKQVALYFVAFFGFIAIVNAAMVTLAIRTNSGVVTEHPYEKGLAYNKIIDAEKKQEELGLNNVLNYKDGMLHFELRDKNNKIITPESATVTITRPTMQGMDFVIELKGIDTAIDFPAKGLWELRVNAKIDGNNYQQSKRIVIE
jgi:nitrogen fixation protein FixH